MLAPTLGKEIGWSEIEYSHIVMAFQAAYALGLVGFGRLVDGIGTRHGYAISIVAWSVAAMAHALARCVFGFGVAAICARSGRGGQFSGGRQSGQRVVSAAANARWRLACSTPARTSARSSPRCCVPWLTLHYGWQMAFIVLGATGFVWLVFWYWLYADAGAVTPGFTGGTGPHPQRSARAGSGENTVAQLVALPANVGVCGGHFVHRPDLVVLPLLAAEVLAPATRT